MMEALIERWIVDHYDLLAYVFFVCLAILILLIFQTTLQILRWRSERDWYELPPKPEEKKKKPKKTEDKKKGEDA